MSLLMTIISRWFSDDFYCLGGGWQGVK